MNEQAPSVGGGKELGVKEGFSRFLQGVLCVEQYNWRLRGDFW